MKDATARRYSGRLALLLAGAALALGACGGGGSSTPQVASLATAGGSTSASPGAGATATTGATTTGDDHRGGVTKGNATALVDQWATCMRSHGDPDQADPVIDAYGVININVPPSAQDMSAAVHAGTDPCDRYLAAAQSALRAANPVAPPPDQAEQLKYVDCMRANGVPNYPDPTGNQTNFNGTGVDPNSPLVERVNKLCGDKLGFPAWWVNGTGPPGDVTVTSGGPTGGGPPPGTPTTAMRVIPSGNGGSGGGSGVDGGGGGSGAGGGG